MLLIEKESNMDLTLFSLIFLCLYVQIDLFAYLETNIQLHGRHLNSLLETLTWHSVMFCSDEVEEEYITLKRYYET